MLLDPSTDYMPGQYTVSDLRRLRQGDGLSKAHLAYTVSLSLAWAT